MMNFSDETVEKLVGAVQKARYMASCDIVSGNAAATSKEIDSRVVAAILSHLTLADLMQVKGVLELVEQANWAAKLLEKCEPYLIELGKRLGAAPSPLLQVGHAVNQIRKATAQFTEAK